MAQDQLTSFAFSFKYRAAPKTGPRSSEAWNDCFSEISNDLNNISTQWNNKLVILTDGLPDGTLDSLVNAFKFGLDGTQMWVDGDATSTSDATYYNTSRSRPKTIKEQFEAVYNTITANIESIETSLSEDSTGLTAAQKADIGAHIFDSSQTSSSTSIDGKSERNRLNILQLAYDLYGPSATLNNNGSQALTTADIKDMLTALMQLHNSDWNSDTAVSHTSSFTLAQTSVLQTPSASIDDSYSDSPATLQDDLNQIRAKIKTLKGTATWGGALTALYTGGPDSLEDLLASTYGTGTQTATNPWGYNYSDIDGLNTRLNAVVSFTGMGSQTDTSPNYASNIYVADGDSLEAAIADLDSAIWAVSGEMPNLSGVLGDFNVADDITASGELIVEDGITVREGDIDITNSGMGVILHSPNGTRWRVKIDNTGTLTTTAI